MPPVQTPAAVREHVSKLSPSAYDRWWRDRIEKEEGKPAQSPQQTDRNGRICEVVIMGDHLMGAGAMFKPLGPPEREQQEAKQEVTRAGSVVGSVAKGRATSVVGSAKGGKAAGSTAIGTPPLSQERPVSESGQSQASYPSRSPSQATGSVSDSIIMSRLNKLEQELMRERAKREAAETDMKDLMIQAATMQLKQSKTPS
mmetsp:Transcript_8656/g.14923  ORF Transcript_8656/g.14923 Transcript_8656/m.14923 type:complete len:200 (+) Transcript_8656:71-670(+)